MGELNEITWSVGDRCIVKPDEGWLQPTRRLAEEGRLATVVSTSMRVLGRTDCVKVQFDTKRRGAKPHTQLVYAREITQPPA